MASGDRFFGPVLKELYSAKTVEDLTLKDHFFYAAVRKNTMFYGKKEIVPVQYGRGNGRSADFDRAKANKSNGKYESFDLYRFPDYSLCSIQNEDVEAAENDKGAFVQCLKREMDGTFNAAKESAAKDMYGDGSGRIGQFRAADTDVATDIAYLVDANDALFLEVGMVLKLDSASTGASIRAGTVTVEAIDRELGKITFTGNITDGIAAAVDSDYVFVDGDQNAKFPGLDGWLPGTAPTGGDNFFGVNRSVDPERLAGFRFDGTTMSVEEALIKSATKLNLRGAHLDYAIIGPTDWASLAIQLGSKIQYVFPTAAGRADISFKGIQLNTEKGKPITVISDTYKADGSAKLIQMGTWTLHSLKAPIRILDLDGNKFLRDSDDDSVEIRVGGYKVLGCSAPGWNGHVDL